MVVAEGFQGHPQLDAVLAVDIDKLVVLQFDDVPPLLGHDAGHLEQLARSVGELDGEGKDTAAVDEAVLDEGGHGDDVHVAAGEDGHHVLVLAVQVV